MLAEIRERGERVVYPKENMSERISQFSFFAHPLCRAIFGVMN